MQRSSSQLLQVLGFRLTGQDSMDGSVGPVSRSRAPWKAEPETECSWLVL